jgi:hypothetical protein
MTGHPVATWRARQAGPRLDVMVEPFVALGERQRTAIEQEAGIVALFQDQGDVAVRFGP